jgi:hypothetical protein
MTTTTDNVQPEQNQYNSLDEFFQPSTYVGDTSDDPLKPLVVPQVQEEAPETVVEATTEVQPVVEQPTEKIELPPEVAAKYADLDVYLKATVGAGLEEVVNTLRDLGTFRQEVAVDREAKVLMNDWSVDKPEYDRRMGLIVEEYKKLTPTEQSALDSTNGAKILWNNIELQQLKSGVTTQQPNVPRVVNTIRRGTQAYDFTQSQIMGMDKADYNKMSGAITKAYASGRVLMDVRMN